MTTTDLGLVSSAWFAGFALAQVPIGLALDRWGPRWTVTAGVASALVGAVLFAGAGSLAGLIVAQVLIGMGCAPTLMGALYLFARAYPRERFMVLSSLVIGLGSAGDLLGATPLALAAARFGWRPTLLAIALLTAIVAVLTAAILRDPPRLARGQASDGVWRGIVRVMEIRALWPLLPLVLVGYAVIIAVRSLWIALYFQQVHRFDVVGSGEAALAMGAAMAVGALSYGPLERIVGHPKPLVLAGSAVTALAFAGLWAAGGRSPGVAVTLFVAIGLSGMTYGLLMAHARTFLPDALIGRGVTLLNVGFIGGAGILQVLSAPYIRAAEGVGADPALVYGRLYLAYGLALLTAAAVYAVAVRRPAR